MIEDISLSVYIYICVCLGTPFVHLNGICVIFCNFCMLFVIYYEKFHIVAGVSEFYDTLNIFCNGSFINVIVIVIF